MAKKADEDLIFKVALAGAAYLFIAKPLLNKLGVDPASTAKVTTQQNIELPENVFSEKYKYSQLSRGSLSESEYKRLWNLYYDDPDNEEIVGTLFYPTLELAKELFMCFYGWPYATFGGNYNAVAAAFAKLRDKSELADIDGLLTNGRGVSLWTMLRNGNGGFIPFISFFNDGLNDNQIAELIDYVNRLPADFTNPQIK